jgi:hypothetical protein
MRKVKNTNIEYLMPGGFFKPCHIVRGQDILRIVEFENASPQGIFVGVRSNRVCDERFIPCVRFAGIARLFRQQKYIGKEEKKKEEKNCFQVGKGVRGLLVVSF